LDPGSAHERLVPIRGRLCIGRQCSGFDPDQRLLVEEESVSRSHAEIRLDADADRAYVVDLSTNGTRLNGRRIEPGTPAVLSPGDQISVGTALFEFRSAGFNGGSRDVEARPTMRDISLARMAMVVGDIVGYSTISEYTDADTLIESLGRLYGELFELLVPHGGTLNNYVGDAFFAVWEVDRDPDAARHATEFALAAARLVTEVSGSLQIRDPDGSPMRMGWAVAEGLVGVSTLTGRLATVLGDATNLAFRISGLAGRQGRGEVLVTESVQVLGGSRFRFDSAEEVFVKGRTAAVRIFAAHPLA
jgi:adenylate cyclase